MSFEYIKGPTSDVTFLAKSKTLEGVFEDSAYALLSVIYDLNSVEGDRREVIELQSDNREELLHLFLSELLIVLEVEEIFPSKITVTLKGEKLKAELIGQNPDMSKVETLVKGVTYHRFSLKKEGDEWRATVVLDI